MQDRTDEAIATLRRNVASETYILPVSQQKLILSEIERLRAMLRRELTQQRLYDLTGEITHAR